MKAMILAAGLGSRLRPLTDDTPKALLKVAGKPLLCHAIEKLAAAGVVEIIVNVHHHADQIEDFLAENPYPKIRFSISDERAELLDTGGALKKAEHFFAPKEDFFLYNADVLTALDLSEMLDFHRKNRALATLAVADRTTQRYFLFDDENRLHGWTNIKTGKTIPENLNILQYRKLAFSGIHIINAELLPLIDKTGAFSIVPEYLQISENHAIMGFEHPAALWLDAGKPESFPVAEAFVERLQRFY